MPAFLDFSLSAGEDNIVQISMAPPTPLSGKSIQFTMNNRFGGISGLVQKYLASGFNNTSGINLVDGTNGIIQIPLWNVSDTSGLQYGNYAYQAMITDSGFRKVITEGYALVEP